jgi:hypothetical protein
MAVKDPDFCSWDMSAAYLLLMFLSELCCSSQEVKEKPGWAKTGTRPGEGVGGGWGGDLETLHHPGLGHH